MVQTTQCPPQKPISIKRLPVTLTNDVRRVITRFFDPGGEARIRNIVRRVDELSDTQVATLLEDVFRRFRTRHSDVPSVIDQHYSTAMAMIEESRQESRDRRLLIGSYFTLEYSIESAALFNPSIVEHPNQENLPPGAVRFLMSLRATGEGHVSSIVFRTGVIHENDEIQLDPPSRFTHPIKISPDHHYKKDVFQRKLRDLGVPGDIVEIVLRRLDDRFTAVELEHAITAAREQEAGSVQWEEELQSIRWLARSNYQLRLPADADASEMVIFPQTQNESRGIEDLRLVRFIEDDGTATYYGTCTAFDGFRILPELVETTDFFKIGVHTLNGARAVNKGMALFPRRIHGHYAMCSRVDGENLYISYSDFIHFWETAEVLQVPKQAWEFVQIGNCGSPLETSEGWLLLTHGVGPMRTYCIGAMLLDLDDPLKVIGALEMPLIQPDAQEREGYVPNVVYSCGAMIHHQRLVIPYASSDTATRFATVSLDCLLDRLTP